MLNYKNWEFIYKYLIYFLDYLILNYLKMKIFE